MECKIKVLVLLLMCLAPFTEAEIKRSRGWCKKNKDKCHVYNPINGKLEMKFKLDVVCDDGYAISPTNTTKIMCLDGGTTLVPNCLRECGKLADPENGKVSFTSTIIDSEATYKCDKGFVMEGGTETRVCQHDGQWSGSEPQCKFDATCPGGSVPNAFHQVCCPASCGAVCGGPDCHSFTGGPDKCCEINILSANTSCKDSGAPPCVLKPFPREKGFILDALERVGTEQTALVSQLASSSSGGGGRGPYQAVAFIISTSGTFPSRARRKRAADSGPFLGEIRMFGGNFAPRGWAFCDGSLIPISQNPAMFSLLGTMYGGDGRTTFALPDMRGRAPVHFGQGPGLSPIRAGSKGGSE